MSFVVFYCDQLRTFYTDGWLFEVTKSVDKLHRLKVIKECHNRFILQNKLHKFQINVIINMYINSVELILDNAR